MPIVILMSDWFDPGLRFSCTQCGACCTGAPGIVRFTDAEAARIAARLNISLARFHAEYTHDTPAGRSLREVHNPPHGYDCVFLDRSSSPGQAVCSLYEDRPTQCRTFPFWPENVRSRASWERVARECEGINRGDFVPADQIRVERDTQSRANADDSHGQ